MFPWAWDEELTEALTRSRWSVHRGKDFSQTVPRVFFNSRFEPAAFYSHMFYALSTELTRLSYFLSLDVCIHKQMFGKVKKKGGGQAWTRWLFIHFIQIFVLLGTNYSNCWALAFLCIISQTLAVFQCKVSRGLGEWLLRNKSCLIFPEKQI